MSMQTTSDAASLPTIHFLDKPNELVSTPRQEEVPENSNPTNLAEQPIKTVSHNRRVHFPADDSQLRLISYPPEPLANQPLVALGVILQRYRATCQRLQLRPIPALLDQLNHMDDGRKSFLDRLDCLKIVNEKIDLKHIDGIEEILSRCRFHTIDLESTFIDDAALTQLFEVIEYYESCTHLNLSNNRSLGFPGYQALGKYLRRTSCLERLDMNSIRFDDTSVFSFTRPLRLASTLYELHLESCQLNGKLLQKFIANLRSCTSLRELYLGDNRLAVQDSLLINELIRTCGHFLFLLDLRSNSLQDAGMSHLASQFSQYDEHHTNESTLHKISLQANQLTQQGVGFLAKALLHNRTLRSLNLSNNNISNEGLFLLRDALLTNRTINELILRNCRLTDQAAIALAEFIAESTTIHYIDLRENNFQASGICGMAIAIKNNKSLLKLDFDPIVASPTYFNSSLTKNNIDRSNQSPGLLSLSNLRRMTTGFSSFTGGNPLTSATPGGGGTRELLEQKARWMSDIAAVCQRNLLIYEEQLRLQADTEANGTASTDAQAPQADSTVAKPEDVEVKVTTDDDETTNEEHAMDTHAELSEDQTISTNGLAHSTETENDEQFTGTLTDESQETNPSMQDDPTIEQSTDIVMDETAQVGSLPDEFLDDDKRKIRHSDSIYLTRKKVKSTVDDDEAHSMSSSEEQATD